AYPEAEHTARRALELDSMLAGAHLALAVPLIFYEWDFARGEAELKRAIELQADADAYGVYGDYLRYMGRLEEAEVESRMALLLDPLSPGQHEGISNLFLLGGRLNEALDQAQQAVALDPSYGVGHQALADAFRAKGR